MWIFYTGASPVLRLMALFVVCGAVAGLVVTLVARLKK